MFSRADYLEKLCTHDQYYRQFVTPDVRTLVLQRIGLTRLLEATDQRYFNDIPLHIWDALAGATRKSPAGHAVGNSSAMRRAGDYPTLAGSVCILKQAARDLVAENNASNET